MDGLSVRKQHGIATILFVLLIPVLFGFFSLSVEGARYLYTKARLGDVTEVASLALAAKNSEDDVANKALVKDYVDTLLPDAKDDVVIDLKRLSCDEIPGCGTPGVYDDKGTRFNEFQLDITTKHDTWFKAAADEDVRFADEVSIGGKAVSRKFQGDPIDVVFVSDFSGSMNSSWNGESKIGKLKEVLIDVSEEVIRYSENRTTEKNTVGMAGFNNLTAKKNGNNYCRLSHLCPINQAGCSTNHYISQANQVDIAKTLNNVFTIKNTCIPGGPFNFHALPLTDDITTGFTSDVNAMKGGGYTASFEGLIEGAQIAATGDNVRRLIVILSDGQDKPAGTKQLMASLVSGGLCDDIRDTLDQQTTTLGKDVKSKIAVIGIDYDVTGDPNLGDCAGAKNVFTAASMNDVYNKLLDLISEEIGRLYTYD